MGSEKDESYESREMSSNDPCASGDGHAMTHTEHDDGHYETVRFDRDSDPSVSGESRSPEEDDPYGTVLKLGSEMNTLFTDWSQEFALSRNFEDGTIKKMENLKKQAYMLEAEFLESKLEAVKKRISET